ncbi:sushi, von Willebrand factor type A, EGF and pentraxin domain-containing protein 1-like [Mya arenaria]|uniref:sushi, von Willebrand factor type A, EGF and pentraxin domain-containing protein 1-like n=1 Tax=Mya arenaria TaxID=6604 RepID=UPI0022E513F6|nr:sushi, von Willebrand factor type A, EGF and pentraxin domain-containing protein 1-like [Mya arenaria]
MWRQLQLVLYVVCASSPVWCLPPPEPKPPMKPMPQPGPITPKSECRSMMDLVLVLDGSDSISTEDYQTQRVALNELVKGYHLGPKESRVGLVVYSSTIAQSVPLTDNRELLMQETINLVHPRDGTMTNLGIEKMIELFKDPVHGGRKDVPWICIVITDGQSKFPQRTFKQAENAKSLGINMFTVGISHFIDENELKKIATTPNQVLTLNTFDQLLVSLQSLMKVVCPCPALPILPNGYFDDGPRAIGATHTYGCDKGYQPIGKPTIECLPSSVWSNLEFSCVACPPPPPMMGNGRVLDGPQMVGTMREYKCADGYASPTPILSECVEGPEGPYWTEPSISCQACGPPHVPPNAYLEVMIKSAVVGERVVFHCNPGFIANGPVATICINMDGIPGWTKPVHGCIACDPPPKMPHMSPDKDGGVLVNTLRHYTCDPGYHPTGPIEAICMGEKGATFWKFNPHSCKSCPKPPMIPDAVLLEPGNTLVDTVREYQCLQGFQPTGPIKVVCAAGNGVTFWDGPHHRCVACTQPPVIPNTILDPVGDVLVGSVRTYQCLDKFVQTGSIQVGCITGNGGPMWTSPENVCITCENPPSLPNALLDLNGDNFVGAKRRYKCIDGFVGTKPGPIFIECLSEMIDQRGRAFWSQPSHECVSCPEPPPIEYAIIQPGMNLVGATRNYHCVDNYHATGDIHITCGPDGSWSKPQHTCSACGPTPDVPFADVLPGGYTIGSVREYVCRKGYVPDRKPIIRCLPGPAWSPREFECIACKEPYPVNFAVLEPGDGFVGTVRRYTCLPGFIETGPITSTCAVPSFQGPPPERINPDWSTPVHFCKDCGDPIPVANADILPGEKSVGSVAQYVCHKGFVPTGPANSFCMQNAEWTPVEFKCIACDQPPILEGAKVDQSTNVLVGTRRIYTCQNGFISTGPIEVTCSSKGAAEDFFKPEWVMDIKNHCKDCGAPPLVDNAYINIGPMTIGSNRSYACNNGFEMVGTETINCLPTGLWSQPTFSCNIRTTTTMSLPAPVKNDPSVCDNCRMLNGVGYTQHPHECSEYVQCYFSARGGIEAVYRKCPFGLFWDQGDLTCQPSDIVYCATDRCLTSPALQSHKYGGQKCGAYWDCNNGRSVPKCCDDGHRYVFGKGCVQDPDCHDICPWKDETQACDKRPVLDMTSYEQSLGNGLWVKMSCAPGTAYNIIDCECSLNTGILPGYVCRPELEMDFDDKQIRDKSGKNVYVFNDGVIPWEDAAYFNGSARLLINRFSNTDFHGHLVIKLRYKEQLTVPTANSLQALVTNGDCGDDPSIIVAKMPGYVLCGAKTTVPKSFALPTVDKEWKEVIYIHDEKNLEGKVCGASYKKWSLGPIQATHCGVQFGYGTKMENFVGLMDDLTALFRGNQT